MSDVNIEELIELYGQELAAEQIALEHESFDMGERRFMKTLEANKERGELANNVASRPLMAALLPKLTTRLDEWFTHCEESRGRKPIAYAPIRGVMDLSKEAAAVNAFITIKLILGLIGSNGVVTVQRAATSLGKAIEDESRFGPIRRNEARVVSGLKQRVGYHIKRQYMIKVEYYRGLAGGWVRWDRATQVHVGIRLIELLIESTGLVRLVRTGAGNIAFDQESVELTPEYAELISKRAEALAGVSPIYQPCVIPPKPWSSLTGGGYWASGRKPITFIRTHSKRSLRNYENIKMPEVYKAVNIAQSTPWRVNKRVLAVANEISYWNHCPIKDMPPVERRPLPERPDDIATNEEARKKWRREASFVYRGDKARISRRVRLCFILEQANKFASKDAIWFPMNLDWRGRVYAIPLLNPQGNDLTKGLLTMSKGKPIGDEGFYWLKIHGANCAGVDKVPLRERIEFIESRHGNIMACAENPLENTWWCSVDSPFCFLAFCFEYAEVVKNGLTYNCSLPVSFDGSCSGLQHYSAMLRDEVGGEAVNLISNGDKVSDIYGIVAGKVNEVLHRDSLDGSPDEPYAFTDEKTGEITERVRLGSKTLARQWLSYGVDRSVTKRSVMTLPYGSREFGFRQQILDDTIYPYLESNGGIIFTNPGASARYLAGLIWEAVSSTVVAAVGAMNWLKISAQLLSAEVKDKKTKALLRPRRPILWVLPDGFRVWQEYRKPLCKRIDLVFLGRVRLKPTVRVGESDVIDSSRQVSGIAPNFIHSFDGCHLRMVINHAHSKHGIESFSLIHDSFGTIPGDAGKLFRAIRESMVDLYKDRDILEEFREQFLGQLHDSQLAKLPQIPQKGKLDLNDILKSDFAFA